MKATIHIYGAVLAALLAITLSSESNAAASETASPIIGEAEGVYTLAPDNRSVRGVAFDGQGETFQRLFVLDRSARVFVYRTPRGAVNDLELIETVELPVHGKERYADPRGLAFARENGSEVLYCMTWDNSAYLIDDDRDIVSQLWRFDMGTKEAKCIDLSRYTIRIGDREPLDLTRDGRDIVICFKPEGYADQNVRVQRGVIRLRWKAPYDAYPQFVRHMPDAGTAASHGMAAMTLEGANYLWGTVGDEYIYCADGPTGRGLFYFDRPRTGKEGGSCRGMCFGDGSLWISEDVPGPDRIHRVNVTKNPDAPLTGPKKLRRLVMNIKSVPEKPGAEQPGEVRHNYSRPYGTEAMPCQGVWPETESIIDVSKAPNGEIKPFTYDPAGDKASRQYMQSVVYKEAPAQEYESRYQVNLWVNPYRKFVYPHRVNTEESALKGTNYLEDDSELFNLTDKKTYDGFLARIKRHIEKKYGVPADMKNRYWAARNMIEYIQDTYYYPNRSKRRPAAVDYDRKHYDANPGNLKIELSDHPYDKNQIIACSGTSVMVAGAMRYLGIPARWLGTGMEMDLVKWDKNGNGLLDEGEQAWCSNGHRYSQVWLGSNYGWICFDGTPSKPDWNDYDVPPPLRPQWRYMRRCAFGHRKIRIVFNIGSRLFRPLYRDFEYDEKLAINNACGGDQRYNLKGRFDKIEMWKGSRESIRLENLCFINDVKLHRENKKVKLSWTLKGEWDLDPETRLNVELEQLLPGVDCPRAVVRLAEKIPTDQKSVLVDLADYSGKGYRITICKDGDSRTGGQSRVFDLP